MSKTVKQYVNEAIDMLKDTDIWGCITGSSMIDGDYDSWETAPDVDVFVYTEAQMVYASTLLIETRGYKPATKGEAWKYSRVKDYGVQQNASLTTLKLRRDDSPILINITWKKKRDNISAVLASFDMSIIMVGWDIRGKFLLDLRKIKSTSEKIAVPNPTRKQDADMYTVEQWVRQFDRCIKYWNRGYDTRPMAEFYVELINKVIANGQLFLTKASEERYNIFKEEYEPERDKMVEWLKAKEDC